MALFEATSSIVTATCCNGGVLQRPFVQWHPADRLTEQSCFVSVSNWFEGAERNPRSLRTR